MNTELFPYETYLSLILNIGKFEFKIWIGNYSRGIKIGNFFKNKETNQHKKWTQKIKDNLKNV